MIKKCKKIAEIIFGEYSLIIVSGILLVSLGVLWASWGPEYFDAQLYEMFMLGSILAGAFSWMNSRTLRLDPPDEQLEMFLLIGMLAPFLGFFICLGWYLTIGGYVALSWLIACGIVLLQTFAVHLVLGLKLKKIIFRAN